MHRRTACDRLMSTVLTISLSAVDLDPGADVHVHGNSVPQNELYNVVYNGLSFLLRHLTDNDKMCMSQCTVRCTS